MKRYVLFAGVNGAGKTTLYQANPQIWGMKRINMDEIVRSIGSWKKPQNVLSAGVMAVQMIEEYFQNDVSFNQETTLCGKSILRYVQRAKNEGYMIELHFVGVDSPEIAKARIAQRVNDGGHGVSEKDVDRRYYESLRRLKEMAELCDQIYLYDNTERFIKVASFRNGCWMRIVKVIPGWVKDLELF